jgi:PKHD-type hydroxylase
VLIFDQVLTGEALAKVRAALDDVAFADGKATASGSAQAVKRNREASANDAAVPELRRAVKQALAGHSKFDSYARPVRWSEIIFSRYGQGEGYGEHVDAPFMRGEGGGEMRADLSFTLFLDDPASYEGGELVLDSQRRPQPVKLAAGSVVVYPTSVLHAVAPVRSGLRHAAVGWIESRFKDPEQRLLLYELEGAVAGLPHDAHRRRLTLVFANLMKMWS